MTEVNDTPARRDLAGYAAVVVFTAFRRDPLAVLLYLRAPPWVRQEFMHRLRIDAVAEVDRLVERIVAFKRHDESLTKD
jgi:hypothetical protein